MTIVYIVMTHMKESSKIAAPHERAETNLDDYPFWFNRAQEGIIEYIRTEPRFVDRFTDGDYCAFAIRYGSPENPYNGGVFAHCYGFKQDHAMEFRLMTGAVMIDKDQLFNSLVKKKWRVSIHERLRNSAYG